MTFLILSAFVLLAFTRADNLFSIDECETVFTSKLCICEDRESISIPPIHDDEINQVTIRGCGTVIVEFGAFSNLQLEELVFSDIESLHFSSFSSPLQNLKSFTIENVVELNIQTHAFVGLRYVDKFLLDNVTVNILPREAISSISNVINLSITNSKFRHLELLALDIQNVTFLRVINSQFDSLDNYSIAIHHSEEVLFENCEFLETEDSAFNISVADLALFRGCKFGSLATDFIQTEELQELVFSNCTIGTIKPDAFAGVKVRGRFAFTNNTIEIAYPFSLTPFFSQHLKYTEGEYCCNYFTCNCNLYWVWEYESIPSNSSILKNSICLNDRTKDLSLYTPILDSYNNCMSLEFTSKSDTLPIKLNIENHVPNQSLSIVLQIILCCLIVTELTFNNLIFH